MKKQAIHRLLRQSLEGPLAPGDHLRLEKALARDPALQALRADLLAQRDTLRAIGTSATFGPFFAAKVMRRLQSVPEAIPEGWEALMFAFRRVSLPALVMVLLAAILVLSSESSFTWDALTGLEAISAADVWSDVTVTL
ncbi:MAG: hypothetical protein D6722_25795 [Bacteroidetes bacterium]|nr:MAG: hypothetical protein D6722_25795 [Bacteroidota bacterium]